MFSIYDRILADAKDKDVLFLIKESKRIRELFAHFNFYIISYDSYTGRNGWLNEIYNHCNIIYKAFLLKNYSIEKLLNMLKERFANNRQGFLNRINLELPFKKDILPISELNSDEFEIFKNFFLLFVEDVFNEFDSLKKSKAKELNKEKVKEILNNFREKVRSSKELKQFPFK